MAVDDLDSLDYEDGDDLDVEGGGSLGGGGLKGFLSSSIVKVLLYAAAVVVVVLISIITATCVSKNTQKGSESQGDQQQTSTAKEIYSVFDLKQFMVNTKSTDNASLARIKLQLAYEKKNVKFMTELNARRPQIRDIILLFFNDKAKEDMDSASKKENLKKELMNRLNREFRNGKIQAIYYEEFSVR